MSGRVLPKLSAKPTRRELTRYSLAFKARWLNTELKQFLAFANFDLKAIERGDMERLREQLSVVAGAAMSGQPAVYPSTVLRPRDGKPLAPAVAVRPASRVTLQRTLRRLLVTIFPDPSKPLTSPLGTTLGPEWDRIGKWQLPVTIKRLELTWPLPSSTPPPKIPAVMLHYSIGHNYYASWPDVFWLGVMSILERGGSQIRRCGECRKLFAFKTRRQEYCTERCSLRGRQRKWITAHPVEASKRRRKAYEKKRKRENPNLKVSWRHRRQSIDISHRSA